MGLKKRPKYDEELAERVRQALGHVDVTERKMFGGLCFMVCGNMACGIAGDDLMVRVGPDAHEAALTQPYVRPMDFTGRPMKGMVFVGPKGLRRFGDVQHWSALGADYARSLKPK
jgi:hypothetical protein